MYTIAVCDDQMAIGVLLEEQIEKYCSRHGAKVTIDICMSGEELKKEIQKKHYDLIFLDIELAVGNGVEVGHYIREELEDHKTEIVYISNHTQYAMELFQVQPLEFLVKPLEEQEIDRVMKLFEKKLGIKKTCFRYQDKHQMHAVSFDDIVYFESFGKKVRIHLFHNTTEEFYGKMSDMTEGLDQYGFLLIHKSYYVNYAHISMYESEKVTMDNGAVLNISKVHRNEIRRRMLELQTEEL